jgi:hypothetical protein
MAADVLPFPLLLGGMLGLRASRLKVPPLWVYLSRKVCYTNSLLTIAEDQHVSIPTHPFPLLILSLHCYTYGLLALAVTQCRVAPATSCPRFTQAQTLHSVGWVDCMRQQS